jgi:hypothetical protein
MRFRAVSGRVYVTLPLMAGHYSNWARTAPVEQTKNPAFAGFYRYGEWAVLGSNQ